MKVWERGAGATLAWALVLVQSLYSHTRPSLPPSLPPQVVAPNLLRMKVWERGAGPTLACGTGACALTVAAILAGKTDKR